MSNFLFSSNAKKAACVGLVALSLTLLTNEVSANRVLGNDVNLRSSAEVKNDNCIGKLYINNEVTPIEIGTEWVNVKFEDKTGYIKAEYVSNDAWKANAKVNGDKVRVRTSSSISNNISFEANTGRQIQIIGEEGDFYKVLFQPTLNPYYIAKQFVTDERNLTEAPAEVKTEEVKQEVKAEEVKVEEKKIEEVKVEETKIAEEAVPASPVIEEYFINGRGVNFRTSNTQASSKIRAFNPGEKVTFIEEVAGTDGLTWIKVTDKNGVTGFVCKNYVASLKNGNNVVEFAKSFIGTPYVYGGSTPSGFDCSGFTSYIYNQLYGVVLPRSSNDQFNTASKEYKNCVATQVSREELMPGDIVCYWGHVAIYVGDNKVIHAPVPGRCVCIESIDMGGQGFRGGIRIIPNK